MAHRWSLHTLFLSLACSVAWAQDPAGVEFQVNSHTTSAQWVPGVASDANGNFVVVWASDGQDGSGHGVFGQRFGASGVPQGSELQVNSYTTGQQFDPAVGSDASGNFVVTWESIQDGSALGIFGQRFSTSGLPQGAEFQVNSYTTNDQFLPAVASGTNGDFVIVWTSRIQDGSFEGIFGQRFDASGLPQGAEFQANSFTTGTQMSPAVASDASGNFVVAWESIQDGSGSGIVGQRFGATGVPQGGEFQVNSYTTGSQARPKVASDANGNFVVVWASDGQDASGYGVFAQRFDAAGVPQGGEFRANTQVAGNQLKPGVASDAIGNFVVVWASDGQDGSGWGVFGQRFSAAGVPQGSEFQINSYTTSRQAGPTAASAPNGNFVVAWESLGQDGNGYGVFGQRFGDRIFEDGFE